MNAPNMMTVGLAVSAVAAIFLLLRPRFIRIPYYGYMDVIDHDTWKSTETIQSEIEEKHQGFLNICIVFESLCKLKEEGLIMHRTIVQLTPEGKRYVHEFKRDFFGDGDDCADPLPMPTACARM